MSLTDTHLLGETAAILTALFWTMNSVLFAAAGRRIGALSVNAIRIVLAAVFLAAVHVVLLGTLVPDATAEQWLWLGVSGVVGLGLGDLALFSAFVIIGTRRSLLLMALAPIFSAALGYMVLAEVLGLWAIVGIVVTLSGVVIVLLEDDHEQGGVIPDKRNLGIFLAIMGAVGQGVGLVLAKYGMFNAAENPGVPLDSVSATLMRMVTGTAFIWLYVGATGRLREAKEAMADAYAVKLTTIGAFIGPFLGVWMSMIAVAYTKVGIAMTLMSLMPVFIIPVVWVLYRERTGPMGMLGAVVAVIGVGLLFLL